MVRPLGIGRFHSERQRRYLMAMLNKRSYNISPNYKKYGGIRPIETSEGVKTRYPITSDKCTTFFDGSGDVIAQYYNEDGKTFKLPNLAPTKQRENIYSKESMTHPAKMYTPLTQELIQNYSKEGDTILDPMCGIGTVNIESSRLGRNSIGVDYEKRFVNESKKNAELLEKSGQKIGEVKIMHGDARKLSNIKKVDTIVTSPPFADVQPFHDKKFKIKGRMVGKGGSGQNYSSKADNIGNLNQKSYLTEMQKVYASCYSVLKPNGTMVIHMKNPIKNQKIVPLDKLTIKNAESVGFKLKERKKRHLDNVSFWTRNYRKKYPQAEKIEHEDILVFKKK